MRVNGEGKPVANHQRGGSRRATNLVGGDRHQIAAEQAQVHRHLAERLNGIGVNQRIVIADKFDNLANRLDNAGLIVNEHYADQSGKSTALQERAQLIEAHHARRIDGQPIDGHAERLDRLDDARMLDGGNDQAFDACAFDRHVVGLRTTRGKDDHLRQNADL